MDDSSPTGGDESFSEEQLHAAVRHGTRAVVVAQIASQVISLGVLAALYRLVEPSDFGLLGMAFPLLALARMLASLGLNVATVQRATLSEGQVSSLFWVNLAAGFLAAMVTAAGGPLLAWAYGSQALVWLCLGLSGTLVAASFGAQHQALLERRLRVGPVAVCRLIGQTAGGVMGIAAALQGWGVWSLVVQQYGELLVLDACLWLAVPWRPRLPWRGDSVNDLLRFGGYFAGSNLMFFLALNLDKVLLAFALGAHPAGRAALGMYTQAFHLMFRPVYLVINPIASVMLPGLSRARGNASDYRRMVVSFYRLIGVILLPGGVGLWLVARDVMPALGGPEWTDAGVLLEAFAPAILVQGFISLAGSVFASAGQAGRLFRGSVIVAMVLGQGYLAGYWLMWQVGGGPLDVAWGVAASYSVVSVLVVCIPYLAYCFHSVGVSPTAVLQAVRRPLVAASCMGMVVTGLKYILPAGWPIEWRLAALVLTGVLVYVLAARSEIRWALGQLRRPGD